SGPSEKRFGFGASAGSSFRAYQGSDFIPINHMASAGMSSGLSPHMSLQLQASATYLPRYQFDFLPGAGQMPLGQATPQPLDYTLSVHQVLNYAAQAAWSYQPTMRSSFTVN